MFIYFLIYFKAQYILYIYKNHKVKLYEFLKNMIPIKEPPLKHKIAYFNFNFPWKNLNNITFFSEEFLIKYNKFLNFMYYNTIIFKLKFAFS